MSVVEEEADESSFWLEIVREMEIVERKKLEGLIQENHGILAIVVSSIKTAKKNQRM